MSSVVVTNPDSNTTLKATWVPSPTGQRAEWYVAQAISGGKFFGQAWCFESDCTSVSLPGVPANRYYLVNVYPANVAGYGPARTSPPILVASDCAEYADLCATVTDSPSGAATLRAQGFQNSQPLPTAELAALQPSVWRMGVNPPDYTLFNHARAGGAKVIAIVSDAWLAATFTVSSPYAKTPWKDWSAYRAWVRSYATTLVNSGHNPDYWNVQNEPGLANYLSAADTALWTPALMLEQFAVAYAEIRAVDPTAKVIGPSIAAYTVLPGRPLTLDLKTFLDYVQAKGIQPGAVAWHEVSGGNYTGDTTALPVAIGYHVDTVRKLLAARNLGDVEVMITEYGALQMHLIPGWIAGYLTSFEQANVRANRTCWEAGGYPTYNECSNRSLSGLFSSDGQRLANYWVHNFYASMTGTRVATRVSTARMSAFAVADPSGVVRVLVGRHEQCTAKLPFGCAQGLTTPVTKAIELDITASPTVARWRVTVNRIPATTGPMSAPMPMLDSTVDSIGGRVPVTLSAVNDGDAITVTLTPAL